MARTNWAQADWARTSTARTDWTRTGHEQNGHELNMGSPDGGGGRGMDRGAAAANNVTNQQVPKSKSRSRPPPPCPLVHKFEIWTRTTTEADPLS
ncbi:unnamed protein product, partial [Sphagnum compactum]